MTTKAKQFIKKSALLALVFAGAFATMTAYAQRMCRIEHCFEHPNGQLECYYDSGWFPC